MTLDEIRKMVAEERSALPPGETGTVRSFCDAVDSLLAVVEALPKCGQCEATLATLADQGPDGATDFTCDACAPAVLLKWEEERVAVEKEIGKCWGAGPFLTDLDYAVHLRALARRQ